MTGVRVRFAPSPTGSLHIGGARTAVLNWLYARSTGGKFLLRIEDTDPERSRGDLVKPILEDLAWLGMTSDEPIVYQSERLDDYRKLAETLIERGAAYRDYTTPEALQALREKAQERGEAAFQFRADRDKLRRGELSGSGQSAVRFLAPDEDTTFTDGVHGEIRYPGSEIDDFVLMRRDGSPTYHLSVVADDYAMGITDIIRGNDHISNTPKQWLIYDAMGWPPPHVAHVPLISGPDKKRLSKRHGAASVGEYRQKGYLPETLFNFIALLGWYPGKGDKEIFTRQELIDAFSLSGIQKSSAVFDEAKLIWMNGEYLRKLPLSEFVASLRPYVKPSVENDYLEKVAELLKPRLTLPSEIQEKGAYFFQEPDEWDVKGRKKYWSEPNLPTRLAQYITALESSGEFTADALEAQLRSLCESWDISAAKLIHPVRLALTGQTASPGLFEMMEVLGQSTCIHRLKRTLSEL
ncbi:glutamate--tRNA ligase [bacterium]|nr:glutamate--tRNA ligase [bacterium]